MFTWLRKLIGRESGKSENLPGRDPRLSEIKVSPPPNPYYSTGRTQRSASSSTVQPRQAMHRASSPSSSRRRDDTSTPTSTDNSFLYVHTNSGISNDTPAPAAPAVKSGGGGEFGGGGASGGWSSGCGDSGGSSGGDGGGGGCGGGECHSDIAYDVITKKLNRNARHRTLYMQ